MRNMATRLGDKFESIRSGVREMNTAEAGRSARDYPPSPA